MCKYNIVMSQYSEDDERFDDSKIIIKSYDTKEEAYAWFDCYIFMNCSTYDSNNFYLRIASDSDK